MSDLVLVYTLFGDTDEARRVSRLLVEERLAACANILTPCISIYEWQGVMREGNEIPVLFKTRKSRRAALMQRLGELHSYDVPAILSWNADASAAFADWAERQSSDQG